MAASFDPPPEQLVNALLRKQAVVFVGSGLSKGAGLPDWAELIAPLKERLINTGVTDNLDDALTVAAYFEINEGRTELEDTVRELITPLNLEPTGAHRELVKLPWQSIVTTNYDRLLEKSLEQEKIPHTVLVLDKGMSFGRGDKVNLIKMHGDVYTTDSIILTKTDYDDYHKNFPTIIRYLQGLVVNHVFLFIGFSLNDRNFQRIWHEVHADLGQYGRKSYALLKQPGDMLKKLWAQQHLEILGFDGYDQIPDFLRTLSTKLGQAIPTATEPDPETVAAMWCKVAAAEYKFLDPRGIFQFERTVVPRTVELNSIFIPPRLRLRDDFGSRNDSCPECGQNLSHQHPDELQVDEPGRPQARATLSGREKTLYCHNHDCTLFGKIAPVRKTTKPSNDDGSTIAGVISFSEALSRCPRLVIIGDPGAGKSTLVRYLGLCAAEKTAEAQCGLDGNPLPLIIELKLYSQALADNRVAGLKDFLVRQACEKLPEVTAKYILDGMTQGRFFILIDGLDEADPARRKQVSDDVLNLMRQFDQCRWLVTSRPAGYEAVRLVDNLPHFTMEPFDDDELARFLTNWYQVFAQWDPAAWPDPAAAADTVQKALQARPEIKAVVQNPLMATILVLVHNVGRELPTRRADFYEAAVQTVAGSWETWKYGVKNPDFPEVDHLFMALGEAAYRLHRTRTDNLVSRETLRSWLIQAFQKQVGLEERTAIRQVDKFLDRLTGEQTGLVVEKGFSEAGEPMFGFVHLTFQEYFTARYLARQAGHKEWREIFRLYLHNPRWEEVIRLLVSRLDRENATQALLAIRNAGSDYEEVLLRDLFLAAKCLTDDPDVEQAPAQRVVDDLMAVVEKWQPDERALSAARRLVRLAGLKRWQGQLYGWLAVKLTGFSEELVDAILSNLHSVPGQDGVLPKAVSGLLSSPAWRVRGAAILFFTNLNTDQPEIINLIKKRLADDDNYVRGAAIQFFTNLNTDQPEIINLIKKRLADDDNYVRRAAIQFFTNLNTDQPEIKNLIKKRLADDDWQVRRAAILFFTNLNTDQPEIKNLIKKRLADDDSDVRGAAIQFFTNLNTDQPEIINLIKTWLADDDNYVRRAAMQFFTNLNTDQPEIINLIKTWLADDAWQVRRAAIQFFTNLNTDQPEIINLIKKRLADDDNYVRGAAIQFFTNLNTDQPEIINLIKKRLADDDNFVRWAAIQFFTNLNTDQPEIINLIKKRLADDDNYVRGAAIQFFTNLNTDQPEIINLIKKRLADDDWQVRRAAIQFFTNLNTDQPEIINLIKKRLADDDSDVRLAAMQFFTNLNTDQPEIINLIKKRLADDDSVVRWAAMQFFTNLNTDQPEIINLIKKRLADDDNFVRWAAMQFFKRSLVKAREVADIVVPMLEGPEVLLRDAAYDILGALPFSPNLIQALDVLRDQSVSQVEQWYANPPQAVMYLLKKADQLRTATNSTPGLLPPGRPRLETSRVLTELGERLLTAVTMQGSSLLSHATAETDKDADKLLWSWRLACICKRYFTSLDLLGDPKLPQTYRRILAQVYDAPVDPASARTFLKMAETGASDVLRVYGGPDSFATPIHGTNYISGPNTESADNGRSFFATDTTVPAQFELADSSAVTSFQGGGLMAGRVPGWEDFENPDIKERLGFDNVVVAATLVTSAIGALYVSKRPFANSTLLLGAHSVVPWLLRFCETLLAPWEAARTTGMDPSDLLYLQGAHLEMGPDGQRWAIDGPLHFRLDCRFRDEFKGLASFNLDDWWEKAKSEYSLMKIGISWFPEIEVTYRSDEGEEETVRLEHKSVILKGDASTVKTEIEHVVLQTGSRTATEKQFSQGASLESLIDALSNPNTAINALDRLHEDSSRLTGRYVSRLLEQIEDCGVLLLRDTAMRAASLLKNIAKNIGESDAGNYWDMVTEASLVRDLPVKVRTTLIDATENFTRFNNAGLNFREPLISWLWSIVESKNTPSGVYDRALGALARQSIRFGDEERARLVPLAKARVGRGRLDVTSKKSLSEFLETCERLKWRKQ